MMMERYFKADFERKAKSKIATYCVLLDALDGLREFSRGWGSKVVNKRFFDAIKSIPCFKDYGITLRFHGSDELEISIWGNDKGFRPDGEDRSFTLYKRYDTSCKSIRYFSYTDSGNPIFNHDEFELMLDKFIQSARFTLKDWEDALDNIDSHIEKFKKLRETYKEMSKGFPKCLCPTSEIYIEFPIHC